MEGEGDKGISLREFGRRIGVSGEAVRKAIEAGRVPAQYLGTIQAGSKVQPRIMDPAGAVAAWRSNTDPTQQRDTAAQSTGAKRARAEREGRPAKVPAPAPARAPLVHTADTPAHGAGEDPEDPDDPDDLAPDGLPTVASSKRRQEVFKTRKLEREDAVECGRLVARDVVVERVREQIVAARNALLGVPTKAKAKIPTLTVRDIEILEDLIADALKDVAKAAGAAGTSTEAKA
jgi:hypothetical protein